MGDALAARNYDRGRIHVLPHSIDTDSFRPPPQGAERDIDVLFVGALIERKQVDHLVAAIPDVIASRGPTSVCIVGDGPARSSLEDQVERLQLGASVEFVGYQTSPAAWFRRSRVIVISSWWEGFPFVLVEAMCSGVVPVSTKVGSVPDIIEHGRNGLLLDSDEPATIAACLLELFGDEGLEPELRRGALASRSRFDYAAATSLWTDWLEGFE
jgi:glycosyltransferase involved in cell wall biosynthesis